MSTRPKVSTVFWKAASEQRTTRSVDFTPTSDRIGPRPDAGGRVTGSRGHRVTGVTVTVAPCCSSSSVTALPMPLAAPVTTAVCPLSAMSAVREERRSAAQVWRELPLDLSCTVDVLLSPHGRNRRAALEAEASVPYRRSRSLAFWRSDSDTEGGEDSPSCSRTRQHSPTSGTTPQRLLLLLIIIGASPLLGFGGPQAGGGLLLLPPVLPGVGLPALRSAVLQHHGRQPLLDLAHRAASGLRGGVALRQEGGGVKVQPLAARRAGSIHRVPVDGAALRLVPGAGRRVGVGAPDGVAPPALVQPVVVDERLQALSGGGGFLFGVTKHFGVFPGKNGDVA
ncbi:hypothetical protein EYF80_051641 [Liparis tanakae]|uniref:Uncharacterized protein n=1 Tax=Liparis tanakae TaxID=230148 RepID=A0A4Z2FCT2_9TELE|nr:hypothetical protein EYF80_051641 [Liparis tanakae]